LGILTKVKKIYRDSGAAPDAVTLAVASDLDSICRMVDELQAQVDAEGMFSTYTSDRGSENIAETAAFKSLATWQRIKTDKSRLLESIIRRDLKQEADIEDY
jgi:hypothetical protein